MSRQRICCRYSNVRCWSRRESRRPPLNSVATTPPSTTSIARSTSSALGGWLPSPRRLRVVAPEASAAGEPAARFAAPDSPRPPATRLDRPRRDRPTTFAHRATGPPVERGSAPRHARRRHRAVDQLVTDPIAAKGPAVIGLIVQRDERCRVDEFVQRASTQVAQRLVGSFTIGESPSSPAPRSMFNSTVSARSSIVWPVSTPLGIAARAPTGAGLKVRATVTATS